MRWRWCSWWSRKGMRRRGSIKWGCGWRCWWCKWGWESSKGSIWTGWKSSYIRSTKGWFILGKGSQFWSFWVSGGKFSTLKSHSWVRGWSQSRGKGFQVVLIAIRQSLVQGRGTWPSAWSIQFGGGNLFVSSEGWRWCIGRCLLVLWSVSSFFSSSIGFVSRFLVIGSSFTVLGSRGIRVGWPLGILIGLSSTSVWSSRLRLVWVSFLLGRCHLINLMSSLSSSVRFCGWRRSHFLVSLKGNIIVRGFQWRRVVIITVSLIIVAGSSIGRWWWLSMVVVQSSSLNGYRLVNNLLLRLLTSCRWRWTTVLTRRWTTVLTRRWRLLVSGIVVVTIVAIVLWVGRCAIGSRYIVIIKGQLLLSIIVTVCIHISWMRRRRNRWMRRRRNRWRSRRDRRRSKRDRRRSRRDRRRTIIVIISWCSNNSIIVSIVITVNATGC